MACWLSLILSLSFSLWPRWRRKLTLVFTEATRNKLLLLDYTFQANFLWSNIMFKVNSGNLWFSCNGLNFSRANQAQSKLEYSRRTRTEAKLKNKQTACLSCCFWWLIQQHLRISCNIFLPLKQFTRSNYYRRSPETLTLFCSHHLLPFLLRTSIQPFPRAAVQEEMLTEYPLPEWPLCSTSGAPSIKVVFCLRSPSSPSLPFPSLTWKRRWKQEPEGDF